MSMLLLTRSEVEALLDPAALLPALTSYPVAARLVFGAAGARGAGRAIDLLA
jgi:hypothetical protein